jgi:cytochrome c peroxidase
MSITWRGWACAMAAMGILGCLAYPASAETLDNRAQEPIRPLAAPQGLDAHKVDLGRRLFHDPLLSRDGSVSCSSCHDLARGGGDGRPHSVGIGGAEGTVKAPTVYNAALNLAQFWDGRSPTLEHQAGGPIVNPIEMGSSWPEVLTHLRNSPYSAEFREIFGHDVAEDSVRDVIATFERSLITVGSRFDRWLMGDDRALSADEKKGYALFKSYGCSSCHQGRNVGGNMFQRFGFFGNWFTERGRRPLSADLGRFNVTQRDADRYVFKVPSLRLAALTPPYFHDGSVATLEEAVHLMARYQLGREIGDDDVTLITCFLRTLPGTTVAGDAP